MPRVDDEQVGFVIGEFLHEPGDAVARVADASCVDDLPATVGIDRRQEFAQPAAERCAVVVGPPVGRRAPQAEDARHVFRLASRETLQVEPLSLVGCGLEDRLATRGIAFEKEWRVAGKPYVGVGAFVERNDSGSHEDQLDQDEESYGDATTQSEILAYSAHQLTGIPIVGLCMV